MRSYGQYCALAKSLDIVGDRWSLLIVRELLLRGRCRYTDLLNGLPGIATNLLTERLRDLEQAGVVLREQAPPPIATTVYGLTQWGEQLRAVVHALGRWAGPTLAEGPRGDAFQSHWLALPAEFLLRDRKPDRSPVTIELRTGDEPLLIRVGGGTVRAAAGHADRPDAIITGSPDVILGVLAGRLSLADAQARGLEYEGDPKVLRRVQPAASTAAPQAS